jgi:hypothetical protein
MSAEVVGPPVVRPDQVTLRVLVTEVHQRRRPSLTSHRLAATLEQTRQTPYGPTVFRAWLIALDVGALRPAFQQLHRSSDPVTLVATSS